MRYENTQRHKRQIVQKEQQPWLLIIQKNKLSPQEQIVRQVPFLEDKGAVACRQQPGQEQQRGRGSAFPCREMPFGKPQQHPPVEPQVRADKQVPPAPWI